VTIRRGEPWGTNAPLAAGAPVLGNDAAVRAHVEAARRRGEADLGEVGLLGGDLCRTLGGPGDRERLHSADAVRVPVDVVRAELDGEPHWFVAHLLAHHPGWAGEAAVAMNAEWFGSWKLGPRAHPNDGLVDVTVGALGWQQRLQARRRVTSGTHLPHPRLRVERTGHTTITFRRPVPVRLDGSPCGRRRHLVLTVEPDALTVVA
jgi:diacylglycerol kinase family enzyme